LPAPEYITTGSTIKAFAENGKLFLEKLKISDLWLILDINLVRIQESLVSPFSSLTPPLLGGKRRWTFQPAAVIIRNQIQMLGILS